MQKGFFTLLIMIEKASAFVLPLLEELATTVIRIDIDKEGRSVRFRIIKSLDSELGGVEFTIGSEDRLKNYLLHEK